MAVSPSPTKVKTKPKYSLNCMLNTLQALYMKAKHYHFNTTGPNFHGDHVTYDGIAAGALEWFDVIGERMRALNMPATVTLESLMNHSALPASVPAEAEARAMLSEMLRSLTFVSEMCNTGSYEGGPTTENIIQEIDAFIGKQMYFIRSSM